MNALLGFSVSLSTGYAQDGISHDSEDDVGLITDTVKSHRRDHHNHKVEDPIGAGAWLDNILNAGQSEHEDPLT